VDKLGVGAPQVTDFLALVGDSSDNIPGVPGVGPKAATALLAEFADIEAIYAGLNRVETLPVRGAKSLRKKLEGGRDSALLSRKLVELDHQVPFKLTLTDMRYRGAQSRELDAFAEQWGLRLVAQRTPRRPGKKGKPD
jgi:DNA polymerase-1